MPTPPPTPPDHAEFEVIRLLGTKQELSQREVASTLGMSLGKANYCLRALITKGFVKAENYRRSNNKLAYFYLLTPAGISRKAFLTRRFLERKKREYESLRIEIEQLSRENSAASKAAP